MAFEYYIEHSDCTIQTKRTAEEFVRRVKGYNIYLGTLARKHEIEASGQDFESMETTFPFPVQTFFGPKTKLTVSQFRDHWQRIHHKTSPLCRECLANISKEKEVFGCYNAIHYPISEEGEKWLMENFKDEGDSYVLHHVLQSEVTGGSFDEKRGPFNGEPPIPLLESVNPYTVRSMAGEVMSFSQIIEYLLGCGKLIPQTLLHLCGDFGAVQLSFEDKMMVNLSGMTGELPDELMNKLKATPFNHQIIPGEDRSISELKTFLRTCWVAFQLGKRIVIDG